MTNKQRAVAVTEYLLPIIKEAAQIINTSEDEAIRQNNLAKVYVLTELLKDLNNGKG